MPDFTAADVEEGTRAQRGIGWFQDKSIGLKADIWEAGASISPWLNYATDEFIYVLEGEIIIVEKDRETRVGPGEALVIPRGCHCRYRQDRHVRKFYVYHGDPSAQVAPSGRHAVKVDRSVALASSPPPPAGMLHSPVPRQWAHEFYQGETGEFTVGVWQTTGYHRKLIDFPRHELMHLLEGSVTFEDDKGGRRTFSAGDTFFVPLGAPNSWKSEGTLRKIYCIFQPAG